MSWTVKGVAWLSNTFLGWARQSVIASWLLFDCLVSVMYGAYYWYFPRMGLLGRFFSWYKLYCAVAAYRALCTIGGLFAVLKRDTRLVRSFYGVYIFNLFVLIWLSWPVNVGQCSCELDWYQCEALQSFAEPRKISMNRLPPPEDVKGRKVPFEQPPPQKEATPPPLMFQHKEHMQRLAAQVRGVAGGVQNVPPTQGAQPSQPMPPSASLGSSTAPPALGGGAGLSKPALQSSMIQEHAHHMHVGKTELLDHELVSTELLAGGFQRLHSKRRNKQAAQDVAAKRSSYLQTSSHASHADNLIPRYFKVYSGVTAQSPPEMPETCYAESLAEIESQEARQRIDTLRTGSQPHEMSKVMLKMMYLCLLDETCAAISWELQKVSDRSFRSVLCTLRAPLELGNTEPGKVSSKDFDTVFVFKDFEEAGRALSSEETKHRMRMLLEDSSEKEANDFVEAIYRASCRCADDSSCRNYLDGQSWCYIAEDSFYRCKASGFEIFANEEGKFWTPDLCSKANIGCMECSGIGHKPLQENSNVHSSLLLEHKTNYGDSCDRWNSNDEWPWCYVGFDSACVDRVPGAIDHTHWNTSYRAQFWSRLPCDRTKQLERDEKASDYCENMGVAENIVTLTHFLGSFLMLFVLFKWISEHCGDVVKSEDMFAIDFSSDEEDEDDEGDGRSSEAASDEADVKKAISKAGSDAQEQTVSNAASDAQKKTASDAKLKRDSEHQSF